MATEEVKVERYLNDEVKKLGGITRKWVSPGIDGVPDRIVIVPTKQFVPVIGFVEVKTLWGKLSPMQEREIKRLTDLGCWVFVAYGREGVDRFIEKLKQRL